MSETTQKWSFSGSMLIYQRVYTINIPLNHYKIPLNHYKIPLNHHFLVNLGWLFPTRGYMFRLSDPKTALWPFGIHPKSSARPRTTFFTSSDNARDVRLEASKTWSGMGLAGGWGVPKNMQKSSMVKFLTILR